MTNHEWAYRMIPILIRWAQGAWDKPHYYSDLSAAVGLKTNRIGGILGTIQDILDDLHRKTRKRIPTLNSLVVNKSSGLPSDGFNYVRHTYSELTFESKKTEVRQRNHKAHQYDWNWVLNALELQPAKIFNNEDISAIQPSNHGYGGEGKEHQAIKQYICSHPESIGIKNATFAETEHILLSGDRLDVYLECKKNRHIAVEVKPASSSDSDITRGIFQCVKYQAVMDATRMADYGNYDNETILVMAGTMSEKNRQLANDLAIKYIEKYLDFQNEP